MNFLTFNDNHLFVYYNQFKKKLCIQLISEEIIIKFTQTFIEQVYEIFIKTKFKEDKLVLERYLKGRLFS